jgi:NAD(P)-dependent dehydrogenase (short-subunit alcohol dehydrogenase family)
MRRCSARVGGFTAGNARCLCHQHWMKAKTVLITGCTRGLGRAMITEFVRHGWQVAGCGRSVAAVQEIAKSIPAPHFFAACDVTDHAAVSAFAADVMARLGPPDLVLNNAAIINAGAPLWQVPPEEFQKMISANIAGTFHVIRAFLPDMIAAGRGVVVNFSSGWGRSTSPEVAPYCATKWAIEGLTQALSQELPRGLATVALNPGIIDTEMLRSCFGTGASAYPSPEAWARTAVPFLAGLGPQHNGQAITAP